jgi:hypothetical protein
MTSSHITEQTSYHPPSQFGDLLQHACLEDFSDFATSSGIDDRDDASGKGFAVGRKVLSGRKSMKNRARSADITNTSVIVCLAVELARVTTSQLVGRPFREVNWT